ncbi:MAG: helix-turn-helix transcriptional regulator [Lachnospiraceae bacterium]|nr:helix-turn-helix transcriptional regulator [Lachnospiraceae bacterium]
MNNEQIVTSIRLLCQEHNITITKLEETLGMSQGLISRWNKSDPSLSKVIDIANYFKVSLDEVTGYKNIVNDKFIGKLLFQTTNEILKWHIYNNDENDPKQYFEPLNDYGFLSQEDANDYFRNHTELSYYTQINNGYVSIYCYYEYDNIKTPINIKLFIQPNKNTSLILQDYTKEQLLPLWLKILYTLNEEAPDEIKAEELKNSFVLEDDNVTFNSVKTEKSDSILKDPSLTKLIETFSTPEFQKMQQTFSSPEFQNVIQLANKIQQKLGTVQLPIHPKED